MTTHVKECSAHWAEHYIGIPWNPICTGPDAIYSWAFVGVLTVVRLVAERSINAK